MGSKDSKSGEVVTTAPQAAELAEYHRVLTNLYHLKVHKEKYGKDEMYKIQQPIAWAAVRKLLKVD